MRIVIEAESCDDIEIGGATRRLVKFRDSTETEYSMVLDQIPFEKVSQMVPYIEGDFMDTKSAEAFQEAFAL